MEQDYLPDHVFDKIREFFYQRTGNRLPETKRYLVLYRLSSLVGKKRAYPTYKDLCCKIITDPDGEAAFKVIALLTTHYSYFFREQEHFVFFQKYLMKKASEQNEIRVWSAACSTGEEAYSLGISARLAVPGINANRLKILGTDISRQSVEKAREGKYKLSVLEDYLPDNLIGEFFSVKDDTASVKDDIKELIRFRHMNLLDEFPFRRKFHVIFLRNILYYIKTELRDELLMRISGSTEKGGFLVLGLMDSATLRGFPFVSTKYNIFRRL